MIYVSASRVAASSETIFRPHRNSFPYPSRPPAPRRDWYRAGLPLVLPLKLGVRLLPEVGLLVMRTEHFSPLIIGRRQRPTPRRRSPRLRQHHGILNRDLVHKIIFRRPAEALDHVFLIARKPLRSRPRSRSSSHTADVPEPRVNRDYVDDQRVSLPTSRRIAIERRIRILRMHASIRIDHAHVEGIFIQNRQPPRRLNQLHGSVLNALLQRHAGSAGLIAVSIRNRPRVFAG